MSAQRKTSAAPDILQLNMEIISRELNDLIVTGEQEFGMSQQFSMAAVKTTAQSFTTTTAMANNFQVPTYIANAFYSHHQLYGPSSLQNIRHNLHYYPKFQQSVPISSANIVAGASNILTTPSYLCGGKYLSHSSLRPTQSPYSKATSSPSYEFHYLRSNGEHEKKFSASMAPSSGQGAFRKVSKLTQKHFSPKMQNATADGAEIKLDLSALDFYNQNKESCVVRRLFDLLRDLHHAVAETPPSFELNTDSQFEETFAPTTNKKSTMPSTLNVQNQVKQACRKLTIFTYEMQRILNGFKMFENEMHAECDFFLNQLRQYLNQLEMYKRIVMEHKQGKFLRDDIKVHAERLSLLLEHTNRQIREVHIRMLAVDWYIGVKYRGDVHLAAMQLNAGNNKETPRKSEIGVINEILQMCNTTLPASTTINTETATTTTNAQAETTNKSQDKLINNQEVMTVNPLSTKSGDIFNVYRLDQNKRVATMVNTTSCSHTRHPVFYIG